MRRGAALPMVLFAITMASALAVSGTYVTRQLAASARAAQRLGELEPAAERALAEAIVSWDGSARVAQPIGTVVALPGTLDAGVQTSAWITRTSDRTYWLVAEASGDIRPPLRRRIGLLVRTTEGLPALVSARAWSELP